MRRILGIAVLAVLVLALGRRAYLVSCSGDGIRGAGENTLRQDLFTLRHVLGEYRLDNNKRPQTLEELVATGYIREVPVDPVDEAQGLDFRVV
jgi:general secretion pathway protein G